MEVANEILRRAVTYFAAGSLGPEPHWSVPLASMATSVRLTCGVLGHSTQAYDAWLCPPLTSATSTTLT